MFKNLEQAILPHVLEHGCTIIKASESASLHILMRLHIAEILSSFNWSKLCLSVSPCSVTEPWITSFRYKHSISGIIFVFCSCKRCGHIELGVVLHDVVCASVQWYSLRIFIPPRPTLTYHQAVHARWRQEPPLQPPNGENSTGLIHSLALSDLSRLQ